MSGDQLTLLTSITLAFVAMLFSIIAFFVVREFKRVDNVADALNQMQTAVANSAVLTEQLEQIKVEFYKFFGDHAEKATMWAKIDELADGLKELSEKVEAGF